MDGRQLSLSRKGGEGERVEWMPFPALAALLHLQENCNAQAALHQLLGRQVWPIDPGRRLEVRRREKLGSLSLSLLLVSASLAVATSALLLQVLTGPQHINSSLCWTFLASGV